MTFTEVVKRRSHPIDPETDAMITDLTKHGTQKALDVISLTVQIAPSQRVVQCVAASIASSVLYSVCESLRTEFPGPLTEKLISTLFRELMKGLNVEQ